MSLTAQHKVFHIAVFGSVLVVMAAAITLKTRYSAEFISPQISSSPASFVVRGADDPNVAGDRYGGATPEETFSLFLAALEDGDTLRASKYFIGSREKEWVEAFGIIKNGQGLGQMHDDLQNARETWQRMETSENSISFKYKNGENDATVVFVKNLAEGIWKIQSL